MRTWRRGEKLTLASILVAVAAAIGTWLALFVERPPVILPPTEKQHQSPTPMSPARPEPVPPIAASPPKTEPRPVEKLRDETGPTATPVAYEGPFRFTLKSCERPSRDERVRCELLVENRSAKEESIFLNPMYYTGGRLSYLSDENGRQYPAAADVSMRRVLELGADATRVLPGVPVMQGIEFDRVPISVKLAIVVIEADQGYLGRKMTLVFQNIVIQ